MMASTTSSSSQQDPPFKEPLIRAMQQQVVQMQLQFEHTVAALTLQMDKLCQQCSSMSASNSIAAPPPTTTETFNG